MNGLCLVGVFLMQMCVCPEPVLASSPFFTRKRRAMKHFAPNDVRARHAERAKDEVCRREQRLQKHRFVSQLCLCWSRACLGKMIILHVKRDQ